MALWLTLAVLGVDSGYEPAADGRLEYILQIEPQLIDGLKRGEDILSEIPADLDIRHYRVTIGNAPLPHRKSSASGARTQTVSRPIAAFADQPSAGQPTVTDARAGFLPNAAGDRGEFVVEIAPDSLVDLKNHDLVGDLPDAVRVTRLRISTQPSVPAAEPGENATEYDTALTGSRIPTSDDFGTNATIRAQAQDVDQVIEAGKAAFNPQYNSATSAGVIRSTGCRTSWPKTCPAAGRTFPAGRRSVALLRNPTIWPTTWKSCPITRRTPSPSRRWKIRNGSMILCR